MRLYYGKSVSKVSATSRNAKSWSWSRCRVWAPSTASSNGSHKQHPYSSTTNAKWGFRSKNPVKIVICNLGLSGDSLRRMNEACLFGVCPHCVTPNRSVRYTPITTHEQWLLQVYRCGGYHRKQNVLDLQQQGERITDNQRTRGVCGC